MKQGLRSVQKHRQGLNISAQQLQVLAFVHLTSQELEQRIADELQDNPALEQVPQPGAALNQDTNNSTPEQEERSEWTERILRKGEFEDSDGFLNGPISGTSGLNEALIRDETAAEDFRVQLFEQLSFLSLSEQDSLICAYLVDALDADGYLRFSVEDVCDDISFSNHIFVQEEAVERNLARVQSLDPAGVAARDLRECLLLQLQRVPVSQHPSAPLAVKIVADALELLADKQLEKIGQLTRASMPEVAAATALITQLQPYPVGYAHTASSKDTYLYPDFLLQHGDNGQLEVFLAHARLGTLQVNKAMVAQLQAQRKQEKEDALANMQHKLLQTRVAEATTLVDMIRQREATLQSVIHTIVDLQEAFFKSGDPSAMKPMGLKDIEDITGLDISTISRVTSNKYMQTPFGMVKLKDLFNQGIGKKDGSTVNTQEVEQRIAQLIEKEDKQNPLSDQAIAEQLDTDGYIVARRTVAKYRALMHIPAAKQRQQPTTEQL